MKSGRPPVRQAVLEALGVPEGLLPLLASLVGNDFVEQAHRSPTRTGPCTLNAVPAPVVCRLDVASLALAPTTSCVWRSVPYLTSPRLCGAGTSLRALRGQTRDTESDERTEQQASLSALHGALLPGRHASGGLLIEAVGAELRLSSDEWRSR